MRMHVELRLRVSSRVQDWSRLTWLTSELHCEEPTKPQHPVGISRCNGSQRHTSNHNGVTALRLPLADISAGALSPATEVTP